MQEEIKEQVNIIEQYIKAKYGSVNEFVNIWREDSGINVDFNFDFVSKMRLGFEICSELHIDFMELFSNESIKSLNRDRDRSNGSGTAEEMYQELNPNAKKKVIKYMNDILEN